MPEHPQAQLELAGTGSRCLAALVDAVVLGLLAAAILAGFGYTPWSSPIDQWGTSGYVGLVLVIGVLLSIGYYMLFELLWDGQSPGKSMMGLAVVRDDGGRVGVEESVLRNVLRLVDYVPGLGLLGWCLILSTSRRKRLGDMVAGTVVISVRDAQRDEPITIAPPTIAPPRVPQELKQPMIERARPHLSALTPQEADTIARFIERRLALDPDARAAVATRIADSLREKFPGLPPQDVPSPEAFLEIIHAARIRLRE